ncbi:response regulator [Mesorhizobium amorphae]|uniref:response regulator n=1 Tax=Mesorhizobium amorphae TaxID=71433 RepID=UPI0017816A02|nr:response regulator [Mesorhizobium amorphae]
MDKLLSGRRILVVEDEILVLMMIEDMLGDLGCESVTSAATIEKAIALIEAQVFDAAMLDMNLDGDDSNAVADALAERGVPFIYSTGNSGRDMREGFSSRAVLRKPFSFDELSSKLERLLSR